jgi:histidyl-tRNA synthetase
MDIGALPGFREFYPDDLALRAHISATWRRVAARYGFEEYDGPPLEPLELYTRKSGAEIVGQLYEFQDKGGRAVALRPEMTPTFARMVSARAPALPKPIRWFSVPQLFRYERPQRGRLREHFQLNLDIVGESDVIADVELVAAAIDILREFGLDASDFEARVSDRQLMTALLSLLGIEEAELPAAFAALDKAGSREAEWVRHRLRECGASEAAAAQIVSLTDLSFDELLAEYGEAPGVPAAAGRLERFFQLTETLGLGDYVTFDPGLVRGLAYYTGLVFELWDRKGELRAICGGGRYDDLLASLGGLDLPALGFGMGDVVLAELLRQRDLVPSRSPAIDDYVAYIGEELRPLALRVTRALREKGRRATFDYSGRGLGRQLKAAGQAGASRALVLGPDEVEQGSARVKDMKSGEERLESLESILGDGLIG